MMLLLQKCLLRKLAGIYNLDSLLKDILWRTLLINDNPGKNIPSITSYACSDAAQVVVEDFMLSFPP